MTTKEAIENLYLVFAKYTTSNMHYCDCGCIDPAEVKKLTSKELRTLEEDDFSYYHGSALYTWGEIEHYKHFLPRILEAYHQLNGKGLIGLFEIIQKLEYAEWKSWERDEIKAIKDFILADWNDFVNERASEIGADDLEYNAFFLNLPDLIKVWDVINKENGLKNFIPFFYYHGAELLNKGLKLDDKSFYKEFIGLIHRDQLIEKLEDEFFRVEESNIEYAQKVSVVLQMVEQEKTSAYRAL